MYGYEFTWASFQVVEVMSSSTFKEKAIGYLAASLSFKPDTDVLMLTTNLIKKVYCMGGDGFIVGSCICEEYGGWRCH